MEEYVIKNRHGDLIKFTFLEDNKTCLLSNYNPDWISYVVDDKRNIMSVDAAGGPFIGLGMNILAECLNYKVFLNSPIAKVVKKIEMEVGAVKFYYEEEKVKSHEKNNTKKKSKTTKESKSQEED